MGHVYEVACKGSAWGVPYANVFHVWDGAETSNPDAIADVFENNYLTDVKVQQSDHLTYNRIDVTPLDVGNGVDPISRVISIQGSIATEMEPNGVHVFIKLLSEDNGFKHGGKMLGAIPSSAVDDNSLGATALAALQTIYDDLITDLTAASLNLAIYRPSLSTPGFPSISITSNPVVKGISTNNRRGVPFQI